MANFIGRLPSLRRHNPAVEHRRLGSTPPSPDETDLAELRHGPVDPSKAGSNRRSSKGKGKEVDPSERGLPSPPNEEDHGVAEQELYPATAGTGKTSRAYPPTTEEEQETKRVEENLKRWELLEKQRRKAARDSRTLRQPTTLLEDVANYVTSSPTANGYTKPSAPWRKSGDFQRITTTIGWTATGTRDSHDEVELERQGTTDTVVPAKREQPQHAPRVLTASPPTIEAEGRVDEEGEADRRRRPMSASPSGSDDSFETAHSRSTSRTDPQNPFSPDPDAQEIDLKSLDSVATERGPQPPIAPDPSPVAPETYSAAEDPFKNPSPTKELDAPLLASPTSLSPAASPRLSSRATLQVPPKTSRSKSPKRAKTAPAPPPLVRPLDLPEPRMPTMEPAPELGHFRRVQHDPQQQQELEEELEGDREHGRWWTDWLCGCRESRRREEQDGRTNPFE